MRSDLWDQTRAFWGSREEHARASVFGFRISQRYRADGNVLGNAPRVDADLFSTDKEDAFSKISEYVWTGP